MCNYSKRKFPGGRKDKITNCDSKTKNDPLILLIHCRYIYCFSFEKNEEFFVNAAAIVVNATRGPVGPRHQIFIPLHSLVADPAAVLLQH